jgi:hypothetical protein
MWVTGAGSPPFGATPCWLPGGGAVAGAASAARLLRIEAIDEAACDAGRDPAKHEIREVLLREIPYRLLRQHKLLHLLLHGCLPKLDRGPTPGLRILAHPVKSWRGLRRLSATQFSRLDKSASRQHRICTGSPIGRPGRGRDQRQSCNTSIYLRGCRPFHGARSRAHQLGLHSP